MDHDNRITGNKLTTPRAGILAKIAFSGFLVSDLVLIRLFPAPSV
jgi:hypothetical protein